MKKAICGFIYYKLLGWKTKVSVPDYDKYIICAAPHTTNWDLFIGKLFMGAIGRETGFMLKKDWKYTGLDSYVGAAYCIDKKAEEAFASIRKMEEL